ncbi:MAG: helix-turn-helix transcriptional regulator [Bauldia sp.]|nr:helix-turn-helix transcriptional regulator [Bauldia sp.]
MGKRPRSREEPPVIRLDVADEDLRARLIAVLGADDRYVVRWHASEGPGDAAVVIADRAVASEAPLLLITDEPAEAGDAAAVLPAGTEGELLEAAVALVLAGFAVGPQGLVRRAWRGARARPAEGGEAAPVELAPEGAPLTTREHEVLVLIAEGASNKMIASRLGISVHTAKFHVGSVLGKLGARSRSDAIAIGLRRGLLLL